VLLPLLLIVLADPVRAEAESGTGPLEESGDEVASSEEEGDAREEPYDPWEGMDRNGRIPRITLPPDLRHPERWRYIPEGRIKPGNVFQRFLVSSFIAPFVFRDGDIGTGFGVGLTDIDFRLKRRREFFGLFLSYTTKGQQRYGLTWRRWLRTRDLPDGGVIQEERSFVHARVGFRKTLTRRYFGPGADAPESDESSYTDQATGFSLGLSYSLPPPVDDLVLEIDGTAEFHSLSDGRVSDVPSTKDAFPEAFFAAEEWHMGLLSGELRWDRRDSQSNPYRGWDLGTRVDAALAQTGGAVGAIFTVSGSKIFPLPGLFHRGGDADEMHPPTDVLAFGFSTQHAAGELPFFMLPTLGGSTTLRGYIDGRWRDRSSWHASSEYRFWVIPRGFPVTRSIHVERVGLAAFYEVGSVASGGTELFSHAAPKHSYGVGVRVSLERAALFRMDIGFSDEGQNFSAGFGVTF